MIPFSQLVQYGNKARLPDGYIESIPDSTLSYSTIQGLLGGSTGTVVAKRSDYKNFRFRHLGVEYIVPSQGFYLTSFKEVYEKGMVYGSSDFGPLTWDSSVAITSTIQNATVQILGSTYKVRLMKGTPSYVYSLLANDPAFSPLTEWEYFAYSIWSNLPSTLIAGYTVPVSDKVTLSAYVGGSTRRWAIVQGGSENNSTAPRTIGRGRFDAGVTFSSTNFSQVCATSISPLWTAAQNMWWPIFEKV